jgi:hypothetical protein
LAYSLRRSGLCSDIFKMRRAAKVDANQDAIVKALRQLGVQVEIIGKPVDLLCCRQDKQMFVLEVKNRDGRDQLTQDQKDFIASWPADVHIVYTPDDAIRAVMGDKVMA